jgi:DNA polymerase I-like protein with 3'-5' exonuclease and polymerase domains
LSFLEQLAINNEVLQSIVKYKRTRKQIQSVETILKFVKSGKIYPNFNQIKSRWEQLTSQKPNLFDTINIIGMKSCFGDSIKDFFVDKKRSVKILQDISEDPYLMKDCISGKNVFLKNHPIASNLNFDELLLYLVIGYSESRISQHFLIDRLSVATIRYDLGTRYSTLFKFIEDFKSQTAKQGYALKENARKYFEGLKSSNMEKRKDALINSVRWLVHY